MKQIIFLLIAISFCPIAEAKEKTVTYRYGYNSYSCKCTGTFHKKHLCDGFVEFRCLNYDRQPRIILTGEYSKPDDNITTPTNSIDPFTGLAYMTNGRTLRLKCSGVISNCFAQKRSFDISSESGCTDWLLSLRFTEIIGSFNFNIKVDSVLINERFIVGNLSLLTEGRNTQCKKLDNYFDSFFSRDIYATVYFANGNRYSGPIHFEDFKWHIGMRQLSKYFYITYNWRNGDYFEGAATFYRERPDEIIPIKGKITYADGIINNDWSIRNDEKGYFTYGKTPTQLREIVAKKREEERLKELAEQQRKAEEARKEAERNRKIIQKYGQKYGQLIIDKELALGMTKEMCKQVVTFEFYDVQTYNSAGHTYEKWTYNKARVEGEIFRQGPEAAKLYNGLSILLWSFGNNIDNIAAPYKMLKFTDGKLTDMY